MKRGGVKLIVSLTVWLLILCVIWASPDCECECNAPIATKVILVVVILFSAYGVSEAVDKLIDWGDQ